LNKIPNRQSLPTPPRLSMLISFMYNFLATTLVLSCTPASKLVSLHTYSVHNWCFTVKFDVVYPMFSDTVFCRTLYLSHVLCAAYVMIGPQITCGPLITDPSTLVSGSACTRCQFHQNSATVLSSPDLAAFWLTHTNYIRYF